MINENTVINPHGKFIKRPRVHYIKQMPKTKSKVSCQ